MPLLRRRAARAWIVVLVCPPPVAWCGVAGAAETPVPSREELVRRWDLNSDGSIDAGEAEVARSRMRRDRAELKARAGIDPLTGKPRTLPTDDQAAGPPDPAPDLSVEERPAGQDGPRDKGLPGNRAPDAAPPIPSVGRGAAPAGRPTVRGAADGGSGVGTGGARAGAPARPGYGARTPRPDLNAGRLPGGLPGNRPSTASGGLLPSLRRTPATPPSAPVPRRTVDDFDVY